MNPHQQAWKELEKDFELYQFYLELILKSAGVVFLMTGAILSYYFANTAKPHLRLALWLPVLINAGMAAICIISIPFANTLRDEHLKICTRAGLDAPYELGLLPLLLKLMAAAYLLILAGTIGAALGYFI